MTGSAESTPYSPAAPAAFPWGSQNSYRKSRSHAHDWLELNLILRGQASIVLEGERLSLCAGDLLWLPPSCHHVLLDVQADFRMWVLWLSAAASGQRLGPRQIAVQDREDLLALSQVLERQVAGGGGAALAVAISELAGQAWDAGQAGGPAPSLHPAVAEALQLLQADSDPGSTSCIAEQVGLSRARLSRLFHAQLGVSLSAYRQSQRLERFCALRESQPGQTLLASALAAGFGSYMACYRAYRQRFGHGPRADESDR